MLIYSVRKIFIVFSGGKMLNFVQHIVVFLDTDQMIQSFFLKFMQ